MAPAHACRPPQVRLWTVALLGLVLSMSPAAAHTDWSQCDLPCKCKWYSGHKMADCTNGSLSVIPSGLSSELQVLDVSYNRFTILPGDAFRSVGLVNVQKVYLKQCGIEELHKDALNGLGLLIELDLSGNRIKTLHPGVFGPCWRLRLVALNRNPIQKLQNRVFFNLTFLRTVEMNDCEIESIDHEAFVKVNGLQKLGLAGNSLTNLKADTLIRMQELKSVVLQNNPWRCDCHLKSFWEWIMGKKLYEHPTACREPSRLRNRLWSELTPDELACKPEVSLHPAEGLQVHGGDVTLGCRVLGSPEPVVRWVYKARVLQNDSRRINDRAAYVVRDGLGVVPRWVNLTITDARFTDDGEYACVARNPGGVAEAKTRLQVLDAATATRGSGFLGSSLGDAWPLVLGLVGGMAVLLVIVVILICCYCRAKDPRVNNNTKKAMGEGVASNGDLGYHSAPGSEQEKSLITVVNPVQKPPRRYETLTSAPNEMEMKATLLDNGSVITGPSVATESDDPLQDQSLESLANVPARSRETFDGEMLGRGGGGSTPGPAPTTATAPNLPPDLLTFPPRGCQVSPAGSTASTAPDSSRLPPQHGPQSPVRSPMYAPVPHLFGTLPYSRSQSPFAPAPVVLPRHGYVTIPRRPRVPSWSSPPPQALPLLVFDPVTSKLEPVYDNLGPRTTVDGSSVLSLNKAGESPASGMRGRPLPPTPTALPTYYSPIAEQPSPATPRRRSNPDVGADLGAVALAPLSESPRTATPTINNKRASIASPTGKVPPKPPPKPKKKTQGGDTSSGPLYEDEGEDGTEV